MGLIRELFKSFCNRKSAQKKNTDNFCLTIELASEHNISSFQWKSAIIIFVCTCIVFFYGTFTHTSTNKLDGETKMIFHAGAVALTNATNSSIAHTPLKNSKETNKVGGKNHLKL